MLFSNPIIWCLVSKPRDRRGGEGGVALNDCFSTSITWQSCQQQTWRRHRTFKSQLESSEKIYWKMRQKNEPKRVKNTSYRSFTSLTRKHKHGWWQKPTRLVFTLSPTQRAHLYHLTNARVSDIVWESLLVLQQPQAIFLTSKFSCFCCCLPSYHKFSISLSLSLSLLSVRVRM